MADACQIESFIAAENAGQVIAYFIVIKVCGVIFPIIQRFEKCRDFDSRHQNLLVSSGGYR